MSGNENDYSGQNSTELAQSRTEKAEERTDLAEDRTLLANERTFAGWARTSFASIGLGLGFQALFRKVEPDWAVMGGASLFVLLGVWVIWKAERKASKLQQQRSANCVKLTARHSYLLIAIAATTGAVLLLIAMWTLM